MQRCRIDHGPREWTHVQERGQKHRDDLEVHSHVYASQIRAGNSHHVWQMDYLYSTNVITTIISKNETDTKVAVQASIQVFDMDAKQADTTADDHICVTQ